MPLVDEVHSGLGSREDDPGRQARGPRSDDHHIALLSVFGLFGHDTISATHPAGRGSKPATIVAETGTGW
ncbi:hypothetical protein GCM10025883_28330 [Mobilicoccus caccae]|uniref:Uncharacterized protein n=1 Tax=Mobilicoccus caccae TaxID=1859295 RepID=A0ABQ6IVS3_9MICO|nr:hypothetical protein GCM10025883_28330 [Mobilicoccus caccae]